MTGRALVKTKRGRCYVGVATLRDGAITMPDARLRHVDVRGTRFYDPAERAWSRSEWAEVEWLGDREAVAA
jgi:hypothetical protein